MGSSFKLLSDRSHDKGERKWYLHNSKCDYKNFIIAHLIKKKSHSSSFDHEDIKYNFKKITPRKITRIGIQNTSKRTGLMYCD